MTDELKVLKAYLEMEQMRSEGKFDFKIEIDPTLLLDEIFLPPMLMQPFLENSIWHRMQGRDEGGLITLKLKRQGQYLEMVVEDNGTLSKGKVIAEPLTEEKKTSLGLSIVRERINALRELRMADAVLEEHDLKNETGMYLGKQIIFRISLEHAA